MKKNFLKFCALSLCIMTMTSLCGCGPIGNLKDKIEQSVCEHVWDEGELTDSGLLKTCNKCNKTQEEKIPELSVDGTLNESLQEVTGYGIMTVSKDMQLVVNQGGETVLGADGMKSVEIIADGAANITATGGKQSIVRAVEGATLTFRGFTFNDKTARSGNEYMDALFLGGNIKFENCIFADSIRLTKDVDVIFKNCTFNSVRTKCYSVWVSNGRTIFQNCTFKGYRGLKIHEFDGEDVNSVNVKKCLFENLGEKPGVTIGILDRNSTVNVYESVFDGCVAWDTVGSLNGIDGFYECDVPLSDFTFEWKANEIKNTKYKIFYKAIDCGKVIAVPKAMYKPDGLYPTLYKDGEAVTVSDLQDVYGDTDYEFFGWFLDEACTKVFDGVVNGNKSVTLYAKIDVAAWTKNY